MSVQLTPSIQYQPQFSGATSQQQVKFSAQSDQVQFSGADETENTTDTVKTDELQDTVKFELTEKQVKLVEALGGDANEITHIEDIRALFINSVPEKPAKPGQTLKTVSGGLKLIGSKLAGNLWFDRDGFFGDVEGMGEELADLAEAKVMLDFMFNLGRKMGYDIPSASTAMAGVFIGELQEKAYERLTLYRAADNKAESLEEQGKKYDEFFDDFSEMMGFVTSRDGEKFLERVFGLKNTEAF